MIAQEATFLQMLKTFYIVKICLRCKSPLENKDKVE